MQTHEEEFNRASFVRQERVDPMSGGGHRQGLIPRAGAYALCYAWTGYDCCCCCSCWRAARGGSGHGVSPAVSTST